MPDQNNIPVNVVHLLPGLHELLLKLLHSLQPGDWQKQTIAKQWTVKDVVAHLLDGNIRVLSMLRDGYYSGQPDIQSRQDLLDYLNSLNADWVRAMKRVSPQLLILLHEATGRQFNEYYASQDPFGISPFAVDWAGEQESFNWKHIAREYTEKWLHQQQVRDALGDGTLYTRQYYYPLMDTFMLALPYTYRTVMYPGGTTVKVTIPGAAGGSWTIIRSGDHWIPVCRDVEIPTSEIIIDASIAWKLFSKSLRPADTRHQIQIKGDEALGERALELVAVMA